MLHVCSCVVKNTSKDTRGVSEQTNEASLNFWTQNRYFKKPERVQKNSCFFFNLTGPNTWSVGWSRPLFAGDSSNRKWPDEPIAVRNNRKNKAMCPCLDAFRRKTPLGDNPISFDWLLCLLSTKFKRLSVVFFHQFTPFLFPFENPDPECGSRLGFKREEVKYFVPGWSASYCPEVEKAHFRKKKN